MDIIDRPLDEIDPRLMDLRTAGARRPHVDLAADQCLTEGAIGKRRTRLFCARFLWITAAGMERHSTTTAGCRACSAYRVGAGLDRLPYPLCSMKNALTAV